MEQKIAKFHPDQEPDYTPYKEEFAKLGDSPERIVVVHNFIEKEDINKIYNYLEEYKDDENFRGGNDKRYETVINENPEVAALLKKYQAKMWSLIQEKYAKPFGVKVHPNPINTCHFVKWTEGMSTGLHADCERPDGTPAFHADFYRMNVSLLGYINDNYEGGRIVFPGHDVSVKPQAGDVIMFPSRFRHRVDEVEGKQNRYTMPTWYTFDLPELIKPQPGLDAADSVILWYDEGQDYSNAQLF
jgi:predicted 2-oxoglutarate/Fe(II)-dependent dioxygenase YbiX